MKPATDPSDSGIVETTTRRRIIPVSEAKHDEKAPDLWEYLRSISPTDWPRHMVYGYRVEPSPKVPIFKCADPIVQMPNGQRVPVADEQELEFALLQNFGGGVFRLLVKRGPQILTAGNLEINAPARSITIPVDPQNGGQGGTTGTFSEASATAQVAGRAMDALTTQERQSAEIGFAAMRTAADVMQRFAVPANSAPTSAPTQMEQAFQMLMLKMMEKMIDRLDAPPVAAQGANGLTEKILGVAVDRMLNPAPSGAPVSASAELVRQLPQIGSQVAEGLREFRMAREAEMRIVAMQRGTVVAQAQPQVLPVTTTTNPPPTPPANGQPSMDFVENKIVEIIHRPLSAEQAADEAMAFIQELPGGTNVIDELAKLGESGLLQFFHTRPLLKPATNNPTRLVEFIRAFLRMYAEDQAAAGANPAPAKPLPN